MQSLLVSVQAWPVVSALFDDVLSLPVDGRDGFVSSLSGENAAHRESLRKLLASAARAETDGFLETLPKRHDPPVVRPRHERHRQRDYIGCDNTFSG
ncbi:MAG: hypothetical protein ABI580_01380 [Burkholderiaceae bacterium]